MFRHTSTFVAVLGSKSIESALLSLIPVVSTTGESLFFELKTSLSDFNLDLADCVGFGSDGASNMVGVRNSVLQTWFDQNCRYKARTLTEMLHDDGNYLYICFLTPVVKEFDQINKLFQATNADPEAMS